VGRSVDMRGLWRRHLDAAAGAREQLTVGEYRSRDSWEPPFRDSAKSVTCSKILPCGGGD